MKQLCSIPYEPFFLLEVILISDVVPAKALIIFLSFPILTDFYSFRYDIKMPMNLLGDINYLIKNRTKPRRTWLSSFLATLQGPRNKDLVFLFFVILEPKSF